MTRSAWVASAAVHYLATGPKEVPEAMKDSIGHVFGTYMYDVDRIANGARGAALAVIEPEDDAWAVGQRTGANFDLEELRTVLGSVQTDESAREVVTLAAAQLNATRMQLTAAQIGADGVDPDGDFHSAVNDSSTLNGFLLGVSSTALKAAAEGSDGQIDSYVNLASAAAGMLPAGGTITSFLAEQGRDLASKSTSSALGGQIDDVEDALDLVRQSALSDLKIAVGAAVAASGSYPGDGGTDARTGEAYPWFVAGAYDPACLIDPLVRDRFIVWATGSESGALTADLVPDVAALFSDGETRGAGK